MISPARTRYIAASLTAGATALAAWIGNEGFTSTPVKPHEGDRWTIGHGATYYPDTGKAVQQHDAPITRQRAADMARQHLDTVYAPCVRRALDDALVTQVEFDVAVDFAGNYGCQRYTTSSMRNLTRQGKYVQACEAYTAYRYISSSVKPTVPGWVQTAPGAWRFDCSTPGNRVCGGVWARSNWRKTECLKSQ